MLAVDRLRWEGCASAATCLAGLDPSSELPNGDDGLGPPTEDPGLAGKTIVDSGVGGGAASGASCCGVGEADFPRCGLEATFAGAVGPYEVTMHSLELQPRTPGSLVVPATHSSFWPTDDDLEEGATEHRTFDGVHNSLVATDLVCFSP